MTSLDFKGRIGELVNNVHKVRRYSEQFIGIAEEAKNFRDMPLAEVPGWIKQLATSGLSEQLKAPEPRSLAKLAEAFLGIRLWSVEDYFIHLRQDLPPAVKLQLQAQLNETVIGAITTLNDIVELAVKLAREQGLEVGDVSVTPTSEEVLATPERLLELVNNFLRSLIEICVGVDETMNIVYGLRRITRKYFEKCLS